MEAYQTQNLAIAVTLATCGVPFFTGPDGKACPVINFYDADILRAMTDGAGRQIYKGWNIERAAEHAWEHGREGKVVFCFQYTDALAEIVKAYNKQTEEIEAAEKGFHGSALGVPTAELDVDPATAARLACQLLRNRKKLRDSWKVPVPLVAMHGATKTETRGGVKVSVGSFKVMSLNPSDETRARLKV